MSDSESPLTAIASALECALEVDNLAWWEWDCISGAVRFHRRKADLLGYPPEQFRHDSDFTSLMHPLDAESAAQAMREHLAGRLPDYRIDYRIRTRTGAYRWFQDVGRISQRNHAGQPVTVTGIVRDITERKIADNALRRGEERFRRLFEGHAVCTLIINPHTGRIVDANEAAALFYGWPVSQLKTMHIQDINTLQPDQVQSEMSTVVVNAKSSSQFQHRRADGSVRQVEVFSNRLEIEGEAFLYSIVHDITERWQTEDALREAYVLLQRAEEVARLGHWELSLDDFVFRASEGAARIYGFQATEVPLSAVKDCSLAEYRPRLDSALRDLMERHQPYDVEFKIRHVTTGQIIDIHSRAEFDETNRKVFGVVQDTTDRKRIENEREKLILQLESALEHIRTLKGIVPICAGCKKIRDDKGFWEQVEAYVSRHTLAQFSHSICPDCADQLYPDLWPLVTSEAKKKPE